MLLTDWRGDLINRQEWRRGSTERSCVGLQELMFGHQQGLDVLKKSGHEKRDYPQVDSP